MRAFPVEELERGDTLMLAGSVGEVTVQRVDRTSDEHGERFWVRWARKSLSYPDGNPRAQGVHLGTLKPLRAGDLVRVRRRATRAKDAA